MSGPTEQAETTPPTDPEISLRATSIARGLLRTERAVGVISLEYGWDAAAQVPCAWDADIV
jgi:hypothetical protein